MFSWLKLNKLMRRLFAVAAAAAVLLLAVNSYAWLEQTKQRIHRLTASNVTAVPVVYFHQDNGLNVLASRDINGYYIINLNDRMSENYIGRMRIDIMYTGSTKSYMRIYMSDMWYTEVDTQTGMEETVFLKENTDMVYSSAQWLDNRIYDKYFYYVSGVGNNRGIINNTSVDTGARLINFISGINNLSQINRGMALIEIRVEVVQFNRIEAFWNMSTVPS